MEQEEKRHSCLDRVFWYHTACSGLEWREPIQKYACEGFDIKKYPTKNQLHHLPAHKFEKLKEDLKLKSLDRENAEWEAYYKVVLSGIKKFLRKTEAYVSNLSKCTIARENYYEKCKVNNDGHIEDGDHRDTRVAFRTHLDNCLKIIKKTSDLLTIKELEFNVWDKDKDLLDSLMVPSKNEKEIKKIEHVFEIKEIVQPAKDYLIENFEEEEDNNEIISDKIDFVTKKAQKEKEEIEDFQNFIHNADLTNKLINSDDQNIGFLKVFESILKNTKDGSEDKKKKDQILKLYNILQPSPVYFALLAPSYEQLYKLSKILVDNATNYNIEFWEPLFQPYFVFEDDDRIGERSSTGYPFLSSSKSYPFFVALLESYFFKSLEKKSFDFNPDLFSHIISLLDRRKLIQFINDTKKDSKLQKIYPLLQPYLLNRIGFATNFMGQFISKAGFTKFTCKETLENIKKLKQFIENQKSGQKIKIPFDNRKDLILQIDWSSKNESKRYFDSFVKDFTQNCKKYYDWNL